MTQSARPVSVGLIQTPASSDIARNLDATITDIRQAASEGAQIICLKELFNTPYFCKRQDVDLFELAEPIPGPTTEALGKVASELEVVIIASLFEKRAPGLYHNTASVIDADGSLLGIYRKMHIPDDPGFNEKFYFTPGDTGFKSFATRYAKIGVLICWDQWYPEAARITALSGAEILFYPTAIGWPRDEETSIKVCQYDAWETIQRSHAIANGVFVVSVNRVGDEEQFRYWGRSFVADPFGEVLAKGGEESAVLTCPLDLAEVDRTRRHWPFLRDRRIDVYGDITRRFLNT